MKVFSENETRIQVTEAFKQIQGERMTLANISARRMFPPRWVEILGHGYYEQKLSRVWWKTVRAIKHGDTCRRVPMHLTPDGERTVCGREVPVCDEAYVINGQDFRSDRFCEHCLERAHLHGLKL